MAFWYTWSNPPPPKHNIAPAYGNGCEHCGPDVHEVSDWVRYRSRIDDVSIIARYNHTTQMWETVADFVHSSMAVWRTDHRIDQRHE